MAQAGTTFTCTPYQLANKYPCLKCYSDEELIQVISGIIWLLTSPTDTSVQAAIEDAACVKCLNTHEMLVAIASVLYDYGVAGNYIESGTLLELGGCGFCADPQIIRAIIVKNLCAWINNLRNPV